jgi:FAD/FMN-containing dehydrogenase
MPDDLITALRRELHEAVSDDPADLEALSSNFGGSVRSLARVIVRASAVSMLVRAIRIAADHHVPITIRGAGHSGGDQALSQRGLLLVNECSAPEIKLSDDLVEVPTGASWAVVELRLNAAGRSIPVLTAEPRVTVGGTLAVGGYGEASVSSGGQVDLVQRVLLVRPDGSMSWCSSEENAELFRFSLASLGQLGVLATAVLRTVPYQRYTRLTFNHHHSLGSLLDSLRWLGDGVGAGPDFFFAQHHAARFISAYGVRVESPRSRGSFDIPASVYRNATSSEHVVAIDWPLRDIHDPQESDPAYRVWGNYVFDIDDAYSFARSFLAEAITGQTYAKYEGEVLVLAMRRPRLRPTRFPFEPVVPKSTNACLGFGIYLFVPYGDAQGLTAARSLQQHALDTCVALGGRPYLADAPRLTPTMRYTLYGAEYKRFLALRSQLDRHALFNRSSSL